MAVLPGIPGLSVTVEVAGEDSPEYNDPDWEEEHNAAIPETCCYIESKTDAKFAVKLTTTSEYRLPGPQDALKLFVHVDGVAARSYLTPVLRSGYRGTTRPHVLYHPGGTSATKDPTKSLRYNFKFSPVTSVDDQKKERINQDKALAAVLGTIKAEIHAVRYLIHQQSQDPTRRSFERKSLELAEKAMKGRDLSHGTTFAEEVIPTPTPAVVTSTVVVGICNFKYRSRASLQREMIIPRTPSPAPADNIEGLSEAEIRRLAAERLEQIRNNSPETKPSIKRELEPPAYVSRPLKMVKLDDGSEAVDLTDD